MQMVDSLLDIQLDARHCLSALKQGTGPPPAPIKKKTLGATSLALLFYERDDG